MSSRVQGLGEQVNLTQGDLGKKSWGKFKVGVLEEWWRVKYRDHEVSHFLKLNHLIVYLTEMRDSYRQKSAVMPGAHPNSMEGALWERPQISIPPPILEIVHFLQVHSVHSPFLFLRPTLLAVKPQVLLQSKTSWKMPKAEIEGSSLPSVLFHGICGIRKGYLHNTIAAF